LLRDLLDRSGRRVGDQRDLPLADLAVAQLAPAAIQTLVTVAEELAGAGDEWWLFGGAAVALHGLPIGVADVDVLMSMRDIGVLASKLGIAPDRDTPVDRIRSDIWLPWKVPPLGVDFTAGLAVRVGEDWTRIAPRTREAVQVAGHTLYIPSRGELIEILRLFGRPKDLARAEGLSRLS
jgi:hypothetical protein